MIRSPGKIYKDTGFPLLHTNSKIATQLHAGLAMLPTREAWAKTTAPS